VHIPLIKGIATPWVEIFPLTNGGFFSRREVPQDLSFTARRCDFENEDDDENERTISESVRLVAG
jgi:hypothetical protein